MVDSDRIFAYGEGLTLEIRKPELEALIQRLRESGANLDELLFSSINAIDGKKTSTAPSRTRA